MVWAKIECGIARKPDMIEVGPMARLLYIQIVLYCRENLTDGVVDKLVLPIVAVDIPKPLSQVKRLVSSGNLVAIPCGWAIPSHVWNKHNPTKAMVEQKRADDAKRQAEHRSRNDSHNDVTDVSQRDSAQCHSPVTTVEKRREEIEKNQPTNPVVHNTSPEPPSGLVEASKMWAEQQYARAKVGVVKNPSVWKRRIIDRLLVEVVVPDGCSAEEAFRLIEDHEYAA